jgi:hypothetical protein
MGFKALYDTEIAPASLDELRLQRLRLSRVAEACSWDINCQFRLALIEAELRNREMCAA